MSLRRFCKQNHTPAITATRSATPPIVPPTMGPMGGPLSELGEVTIVGIGASFVMVTVAVGPESAGVVVGSAELNINTVHVHYG